MKYLPKSKWKKAGLILLLIFGLLQFYPRPEKNVSTTSSKDSIEKLYTVPDSVTAILKAACYDCHSNNTNYPWYYNVQPVALFLNKHIADGKDELNFDEFGSYTNRRQQSKLKAIANQVKDGEMPLASYQVLHSSSRLKEDARQAIIDWANQQLLVAK